VIHVRYELQQLRMGLQRILLLVHELQLSKCPDHWIASVIRVSHELLYGLQLRLTSPNRESVNRELVNPKT
jgi:hypothetical protein